MWGPLALHASVLLTLAGFVLDHLSGEERNRWEIGYVNDRAPAPALSFLGELQVMEPWKPFYESHQGTKSNEQASLCQWGWHLGAGQSNHFSYGWSQQV